MKKNVCKVVLGFVVSVVLMFGGITGVHAYSGSSCECTPAVGIQPFDLGKVDNPPYN